MGKTTIITPQIAKRILATAGTREQTVSDCGNGHRGNGNEGGPKCGFKLPCFYGNENSKEETAPKNKARTNNKIEDRNKDKANKGIWFRFCFAS